MGGLCVKLTKNTFFLLIASEAIYVQAKTNNPFPSEDYDRHEFLLYFERTKRAQIVLNTHYELLDAYGKFKVC